MTAQTIQVGVLGGIAATDPDGFGSSESKRYVIGPSVEARFLRGRLGIELDALYRRLGDSFGYSLTAPPAEYIGSPTVTAFYYRSRTNSWEFPLIGKYYFRGREAKWRPLLGTGYVLRAQWREIKTTTFLLGESTPRTGKQSSSAGLDIGAVGVAGVEWRGIGRMSFQPQARYTRWGDYNSFNRPKNQVDVGLGIRF
ncbi:MAG TPA: hypothetical protein VE621_07695 [Bryobacteraceae bacterium]|nr:hypothetical protein [Bryobacteraceae bacterium]